MSELSSRCRCSGLTYIRLNSNSEICTTKNVIVNLYVEITLKHKIFYHSSSLHLWWMLNGFSVGAALPSRVSGKTTFISISSLFSLQFSPSTTVVRPFRLLPFFAFALTTSHRITRDFVWTMGWKNMNKLFTCRNNKKKRKLLGECDDDESVRRSEKQFNFFKEMRSKEI